MKTDQVYYGNQPIGTVAAVQAILDHFKLKVPEFRKPFARLPDENDQLQDCHVCGGDKTVYSVEEQADVDCGMCGGEGSLPFQENEVFLTVWREGHSIETLAVVLDSGEVNACASCSEPGFPYGKKVELTEEEQELARQTLGKPRAAQSNSLNTTESTKRTCHPILRNMVTRRRSR